MGLTFSEQDTLSQNTSEGTSDLVWLGVVVRSRKEDVVESDRVRHEQPGATKHSPVTQRSSVLCRPFLVLYSGLGCEYLAQVAEDVVLTTRSRELGEGRGIEEGERERCVGEQELGEEAVGVEQEGGGDTVPSGSSAVSPERAEELIGEDERNEDGSRVARDGSDELGREWYGRHGSVLEVSCVALALSREV